jgi:hypothetical protein
MTDETDDEMIEPSAPIAADPFVALANLLALVADPKVFKSRLHGLHQALTAVTEGQAKLAAERATLDQETAAARAELATERADIEKRRLAVHGAEGSLALREKRQAELEKLWHDIGEPNEVVNGFKDPERPALHKALRAHGRLDEDAPADAEVDTSDTDPAARGNDPAFIESMRCRPARR